VRGYEIDFHTLSNSRSATSYDGVQQRRVSVLKILLIASTLPWPLEKYGGAQRSGLILKALQRWGDVDVVVANERKYLEQPDVREKMQESREYAGI